MVETPRRTSRPGGIRRLNEPRLIDVRTGSSGHPVAIAEKKKVVSIVSIENYWLTKDRWWRPKSVERAFYEVILGDGQHLTIFFDQLAKSWYRIRGY